MYQFKLYIAGYTPAAKKTISELREMFDRYCEENYTLDVLDVFEHPQEAYDDMVLATPMLTKTLPAPNRRIIGNLRDHKRVMAALEICYR